MSEDLRVYYKGRKLSPSFGDIQDPFSNTEKLTYWCKRDETGNLKFLTKRKYFNYNYESQEKDTTLNKFLREKGFVKLSEIVDNKNIYWIDMINLKFVTPEEYARLSSKAYRKGIKTKDFLKKLGFKSVTEPKF